MAPDPDPLADMDADYANMLRIWSTTRPPLKYVRRCEKNTGVKVNSTSGYVKGIDDHHEELSASTPVTGNHEDSW